MTDQPILLRPNGTLIDSAPDLVETQSLSSGVMGAPRYRSMPGKLVGDGGTCSARPRIQGDRHTGIGRTA